MTFLPHFIDGSTYKHTLGKIVCVGRNYAEHARELKNPVPSEPILFIKPSTSATSIEKSIQVPFSRGDVHFETELALLIGRPLQEASPRQAEQAIVGLGLALDLTLRELQSSLKEKGHPWEIAKGFDGACPLSPFIKLDRVPNWEDMNFSLEIDGVLRQQGNTAEMLFPVPHLLAEMSRHFTLEPGDIVLTGTPAGVGVLKLGSLLRFQLGEELIIMSEVAAN